LAAGERSNFLVLSEFRSAFADIGSMCPPSILGSDRDSTFPRISLGDITPTGQLTDIVR